MLQEYCITINFLETISQNKAKRNCKHLNFLQIRGIEELPHFPTAFNSALSFCEFCGFANLCKNKAPSKIKYYDCFHLVLHVQQV